MTERSSAPSAPRSEVLPHDEFDHEGRLKIVIAGLDQNVRAQAIEAANERLNEKVGNGPNGFGRFLRGVWKRDWQEAKAGAKHIKSNFGEEAKSIGRSMWYGNLGREYYLTKYTQEAEKRIHEHENLLEHEGVSAKEYQVATTLRFAHEYDELIHEGEHRHKVLDENEDGSFNEKGYELKQRIFRLIEGYAAGNFASEEDFQEEKKRMMTELVAKGMTKDHIGEGLLYADNLLQIAQNVKAMVEHRRATGEGGNIDEILANTDIVLGEARLGARTEIEQSRVERISKKLECVGFNDSTVATAASIAYSIGGWAAKSAIGAAGRAVIPGAGAGLIAGFREKRMLKEERAQHAREMAVGKGDAENLYGRREDLEAARYETKSAQELKGQISILYSDEGEFRVNDAASFDEATQLIAECSARIGLSDRMNIDLVSFSDVGRVETERFELDLALAKAKCDMRNFMKTADDDTLKALGIAEGDIPMVRNGDVDPLNFVLGTRVDAAEGVLLEGSEDHEGITQKDRIYRKLRNKRVAKAVAKGTVLGMFIGTTAQEASAFALSNQQGLVEGAVGLHNGDAERETLLAGAFNHQQAPVELSGDYGAPVELGYGTKLSLPAEFHVEHQGDTFSVKGPDGMEIRDLQVTKDGALTPDSILALRQAGISTNHETSFLSHDVSRQVTVSAKDFVKNHEDLTTKVTRDFWYDNGTPSPNQAEGSELGLQDPRVNDDGDYLFSISGMESRAASSAGGAINWHEAAANGDLKIALSASRGTQTDVFMVDVDKNGNAIIPKDGPLASLFGEQDGQTVFKGKYAEIVEVAGVDRDGVTHIRPLATETGEGMRSFTDTVTEKEVETNNTYSLTYEPEKDRLVSVPPVLPWYPRSGIGRLRRQESRTPGGPPEIVDIPDGDGSPASTPEIGTPYVSGYFNASPENVSRYRERMSPRLREGSNPDIELNEREELEWYWGQQTTEHKATVEAHSESLGDLESGVEIEVAIPVAGHQEMDTIYHTLSAYLNQSLDKDKFEIVLYVNHPEVDQNGVPTSADETLAEIERFRNDYPEMPVKVMYEQLPREKANMAYIRKMLSDTLCRRSLTRGALDKDLIVVSNDADTIRMADGYLENFIKRFRDNPDVDAMLGQLDWDNEAFLHYPEIHVATRLFLYEEIMLRRAGSFMASSGANFTYHLKNYAAVGGYDTGVTGAGEDVEFGRALTAARAGGTRKKSIGYAGNAQSRLETSARRAIYTLETFDDAPYNQWNYSFSADDDAVRRLSIERERQDLNDPGVRAEVTRSVENLINKTLRNMTQVDVGSIGNIYENMDEQRRKFVERSIRLCGVKFRWNPDGTSISVTDASAMFDGLQAFKQRYERHRARAAAA